MPDDRYKNLPFAPWASEVSYRRDLADNLALLDRALAACRDRPPSEEEQAAIAWLAEQDEKLAGFCRQFLAALALPYPEQRQADAAAALGRIRRRLGV